MSLKAYQEKIEGRFDKVLSYYWDGVPVPLLSDTEKKCTKTFLFRQLAFTPDYHGETVNIPLAEPVNTTLFSSLASQVVGPQPASSRIGSHYSYYVGLFRFCEDKRSLPDAAANEKSEIRVPVEYCEKEDDFSAEIFAAHCRIRTGKLVNLYKPLIKEHLPLSRNSLRNIIILSSRGCTSVSREIVAREISDINEDYATALSAAIFYYMCLNPQQRRLLEPLQLATEPEVTTQSIQIYSHTDKLASQQHFNEAKQLLKKQLFWNVSTRGYFAALHSAWESKFDQLLLLSTDVFTGSVGVGDFISQISSSINSVFSRIRIQFYANVEEFFYSFISTARDVLLISEKEYEDSIFKKIFLATDVFLVSKLRNLIFDGLDSLVAFFDCEGCGSVTRLAKRAHQHSFIRLDLHADELFQPRASALAVLLFGIRDLFSEVERGANNLPGVGCVIVRSLKLEQKKLSVLSKVEVASYRASIAQILNDVTLVIDGVLSTYKEFCSIPVQNLSAVKTGPDFEIAKHVDFARQQVTEIFRASCQHMYCGRFEVSCTALQEALAHEWENYISTLTSTYQKMIVSIVESAKTRSSAILKVFEIVPSNVEELEIHLQNTEAAKALARELRNSDCKEILDRVACMEELYIPIEPEVCSAVLDFMKLPEKLFLFVEKAGDERTKCAPSLRRKLNQLRTSTGEYMQTLSTGVTELYHLFNLETCDIAAQTCAELRELVDRIDANLRQIAHEEEVLGISSENKFDNFPCLLHYFEVIEQFWDSVFDATKLRSMYNSPISSVNAVASVEKVREWRRLIHSSTRHLRGFPLLVQLGREQEAALSKYEELSLFLEVISSPSLRKNHWKDIAKLVAAQFREDIATVIDLSVTVRRLLDAGLMDHMGPLGQIANQAQCDYEVESALEEMKSYGKRTHFVFEDSSNGSAPQALVAQQFITDAADNVEQFVIRCWAMRRYPNLGQLVQKQLLEWEFACEKSCEMLSAFGSVQESCAWVEDYFRTLQMKSNTKDSGDRSRHAIIQDLSTASDAVKRLHATLRKPQFSLYTAMVQDTIQDVFFVVKAAVDDVLELLRPSLELRRAGFPRFRFLSDTQLLNFQFVLTPQSFVPLLPCLYSHLTDVDTADGDVTAVIAADGASLLLTEPLSLTTASPDAWLAQFDQMVRQSLLTAVKNCVAAYYRTDLESWVSGWCGQVILLALRILHTEGIRNAVEIGAGDALHAYAGKICDVCCALSQLALEASEKGTGGLAGNGSVEATIRAALAYEQFALQDVKSAIEWRIHSAAGLDCTPLVQTFFSPSGDSIWFSFMGVSVEYGMEFLGHGGAPFMSSSLWKQMVLVVVDMELGRSMPLVCGEGDGEVGGDVLKTTAQMLGRFYLRVELTPQTLTETLIPLLRGCIETGVFLCLANCETVSPKVLENAVLPLIYAYRSTTPSSRWDLPFGPHDAVIGVPVHPSFRLSFISSSLAAFPLQLSTLCDTVRIAPPDVAELMHSLLTQASVISLGPFSVQELELAELYEQLRERAPDVFTITQLRLILHDMISHGGRITEDGDTAANGSSSLSLPVCFLKSLVRTSYGAFLGDEGTSLRDSITEQIQAQLLLPSCNGVVPHEWSTATSHVAAPTTCEERMQRFATLIEVHRRVLIIGSRFSGKSELWRRWLGGTPSLILSPQLMTASDMYGNTSQKGYLSQMASHIARSKATSKAPPVFVLVDVDAPSSFHLFTQTLFDGRRTPEGAPGGTCVVASPDLRVVATAARVYHVTPGVIDGFAMLALTEPSSWKGAIKWALSSLPDADVARRVLEVLLPPLVDRAAKMSPDIIGSASELTNMCVIAQRAASLCSRWYAYALTIRIHSDVLAPQDDDDEVDLRLFTARCAVMAASWSVGLSIPSEDRDAVKLTLLSVEADVMMELTGIELSGEVFPELTYNSISPLEQVVLPQGWMSFDDAAKRTDLSLSWSSYRNVNSQLPVPMQVFAMPSRITTLRSMECLMNCGQHVLLHGGLENGKTTLLHSMRTCGNWVTQVFRMNAGFNATEMQQTMAGALSRRSNGCYGPLLGRRLVVCIDDLHLSPATAYGECAPLAGCFMSFCEKFRVISTPALGTVPIADVVVCATTLLQSLSRCRGSIGAHSGCVDVLFPPFSGGEVASGLFQVYDMASSRKRAKGFPQECASFLELAHGAYCQLKQRLAALARNSASISVSFLSHTSGGASPNAEPLAVSSADDRRPAELSAAALQADGSLLTEHFHALFEAAEVIRLHLLSSLSDFQVPARVFIGVTSFYDELLSPSSSLVSADAAAWQSKDAEKAHRQVGHRFRDFVVQAAEGTLHNIVRGNVEFRELAQEMQEGFSRDVVSAMDESRVAQHITNFPAALEEEEETDLSVLGEQRKSIAVARTHRSGTTVRAETLHTSVLVSYPDSLIVAAVRAEGLNSKVYVRRSSSAIRASRRPSRQTSSASSAKSDLSSVSQHLSPSVMTTPTYQTTWLTTRFIHLTNSISAQGSHLLLLGDNTFGMRRLFRLWCATSHIPFMWFRVSAAAAPRVVLSTFISELRTAIAYVCRNSVHAVVYVPPSLLRTTEVLRIMDAIVRSGDVSSVFTNEERFGLLNGPNAPRTRSLKPFVFDDLELRERVRGCLNFIFHLQDAAEARQLGEGYPFLLQPSTTALPLHTEELEKLMLEEIALGILLKKDEFVSGILKMEDEDDAADAGADDESIDEHGYRKQLSPRVACTALCAAFHHVRQTHSTCVEQFMEFVRLYKELDDTARVKVIASARTGKIIAGRGDAAVQAVNAATQRSRAIVEELASLQVKLGLLNEKLKGQERQQANRNASAGHSREALQKLRDALQKRQDTVVRGLENAREGVAKALKQLRKAKSSAMRALGMSRVPAKGTLLVRAVYAVVAEEVPKHNDNANELWTLSMKRMCTKKFIAELAAIAPQGSTELLPILLPFRRDLDAVRYAPALPYAQLLADFVVAWVDCVKYIAEDYKKGAAEIAKAQQELEKEEAADRQKQQEAMAAQQATAETRSEVEGLQATLAALQAEQGELTGGEGRLLRYTGLVDRFTRFLVGTATVAERVKRAHCATGDTLHVAAFYTLLAMHSDAQAMSATLQDVLRKTVKGTTLRFTPLNEMCSHLLYQTHTPRTEALIAANGIVPWEYKALLLSLYQRRASRWTLVGGAGPVIVHELLKFLSFRCTDSLTVSATDPLAKERLVAAMRAGEGVLLRDVHGASAFDLVRSLNPIYKKLKEYHRNLHQKKVESAKNIGGSNVEGGIIAAAAPPLSQSSFKRPAARASRRDSARPILSIWLDGQEVRVHPQFFLVCTCWPVLTSGLEEACASLDVFNLNTHLDYDVRLEWLFYSVIKNPSVSVKVASMQEEVQARRRVYFEVLQDLAYSHDAAAELLAVDLRDISGNQRGDALLAEMEQALTQVDTYDGQMAQIASYLQSLQRTVQEGWTVVLPAVKAIANAVEQIEVNRLGRPWSTFGLDSCITDVAKLSPALLRRIAPLSFSDLPIGQKCYHVLTLFLQRVVDLLGPGWPASLKGVFSLSILCTAISAAPATFAVESKMPILTEEQRRVLAFMVYDTAIDEIEETTGKAETSPMQPLSPLGDTAANRSTATAAAEEDPASVIRHLYATSGDTILRRIAWVAADVSDEEADEGFDAAGEMAYDVMQFFTAMLELDIERANGYASSLYNAFISSVTGLNKGPSDPKSALPSSLGSLAEKPRAKTMAQQHDSLGTDNGFEGSARYGGAASDGNDVTEPLIELPTMEAQIQRAVEAHLPLCLNAKGHIGDALLWLQGEVGETKWAFEWLELIPPSALFVESATAHNNAASILQRRASVRLAFEKASQHVVTLARSSSAPDKCGVCLTLVVDVQVGTTANAVAASDVPLFREEFHRLLSLYNATTRVRVASGAASTLCLVIICSVAARDLIWGKMSAEALVSQPTSYQPCHSAETLPCCYLTFSTYTPQLALVDLLRPSRLFFAKDGVVQICDSILRQVQNELSSGSSYEMLSEKRTTHVRGPALAKLNASLVEKKLSVPLPKLPPDLSSSALAALKKSVTELRLCAQLLQYEATVAYVASTTRLHLLCAALEFSQCVDDETLLSCTAERKLCHYMHNPAPLSRLHALLSMWVRQRYGELLEQLGGVPSTALARGSRASIMASPVTARTTAAAATAAVSESTKSLTSWKRSCSTVSLSTRMPMNSDSTEENFCDYGMRAYYFLRHSQPAWGLLLKKAERLLTDMTNSGGSPGKGEATMDLLNPSLCSLMRTADARAADEENSHAANHIASLGKGSPTNSIRQARKKRQKRLIEEAGARWKNGLFVLARKFAMHYMCARHERTYASTSDCSLPLLEQGAQWELLRTVIGDADDSEEVSFFWGQLASSDYVDLKNWHELRISVRHLDSFRFEVASAPSDLMELCGEESAIYRFREVRQRDLIQLCFSEMVRASFIKDAPTDSIKPVAEAATTAAAGEKEVHDDEKEVVDQEATPTLIVSHDVDDSGRGIAKPATTFAETVLKWERASLDARAAQMITLNNNFQHMMESFTSIVASPKTEARVLQEVFNTRRIHLWLPALRHPLFDLHYLTSAALYTTPNILTSNGAVFSPRGQRPCRSSQDFFGNSSFADGERTFFVGAKKCGTVAMALVVVVTEPRFLSSLDVVLCGAQLSPSLLRQILEITGRERGASVRGAKANTDSMKGKDRATEMVVVVRRVLLRRPKTKARRALNEAALRETLVADDRVQLTSVEVGMHVGCAEPLSARLVWCSTVCPLAAADGTLWDTRPTCCPRYTDPTSRSLSTVHAGSVSSVTCRTSSNVFVTELDDGTGESRTPRAVDGCRTLNVWSFSDVPIPILWKSARGKSEPGMIELPLCIVHDHLCHGSVAAHGTPVKDEPTSAGKEAVGGDGVLGDVFSVHDALGAYIWIE